jgi:hypothetical protein
MTSPVSAIEAIEKAMGGVKHSQWFMSPWHVEEDASAVRNQSDGSYICNASSDSFAAYIAACNPVAMREVLSLARKAEALTGIGSAHDLISDWLGEGTDDLPDETPVRVEIGKRTIISDNLGSLRRARALLGGSENAE